MSTDGATAAVGWGTGTSGGAASLKVSMKTPQQCHEFPKDARAVPVWDMVGGDGGPAGQSRAGTDRFLDPRVVARIDRVDRARQDARTGWPAASNRSRDCKTLDRRPRDARGEDQGQPRGGGDEAARFAHLRPEARVRRRTERDEEMIRTLALV